MNDDGIPLINSFPAKNYEQIQSYFLNSSVANYAYVIMAQPLHEGVPAFCLALFGTDNKFTASHVVRRWVWMKKKAAKHGIKILGNSSDGDTRLLKAMKFKSFLPDVDVPDSWSSFFTQSLFQNEMFIQDMIHILTKLRTRFLNSSITFKMGEYVASADDIRNLHIDK